MKQIVETTGPFMLMEPHQSIPYDRPAVVAPTHFLQARRELGQIRILAHGLDDDATDAEFAAYLKDSENTELAIAAFTEKYGGAVAGHTPAQNIQSPVQAAVTETLETAQNPETSDNPVGDHASDSAPPENSDTVTRPKKKPAAKDEGAA